MTNQADDREVQARVSLIPVNQSNWRAVHAITVSAAQREHVMDPGYYLALCCYGGDWQPLAVCRDGLVIGFMMWAVDEADGSCWLGGIMIDQDLQGQGYGRQAVQAALELFSTQHGYRAFALSYHPENTPARQLYLSLGFTETEEWEGDEIVARLSLA